MSEKLYKYYLRFDDAGTWKYYYVNTSGVVSNTTTKTEINYAPKGWSKTKPLKWERGFEYWGVMQSFSLPLEFVVDGGKNIEGICIIHKEFRGRMPTVH
jgi:hypothetical protein